MLKKLVENGVFVWLPNVVEKVSAVVVVSLGVSNGYRLRNQGARLLSEGKAPGDLRIEIRRGTGHCWKLKTGVRGQKKFEKRCAIMCTFVLLFLFSFLCP